MKLTADMEKFSYGHTLELDGGAVRVRGMIPWEEKESMA